MAKAKKPASTGGDAKDTSKAVPAKPTGSVPKTSRPKSNAAKSSAGSKTETVPAKAKTTVASKASTADPVKPANTAQEKKTPEPVAEAKVEEKEAAPETTKKTETAKPTADPKLAPAHTTPADPPKKGSVFWPLLFGGALAAVLGFVASEMNMLGTRSDTSDIRATLSKQQTQIAELISAEPKTANVEFPALDDLTDQLQGLSENVTAIEARLTDVEKRPVTGGSSSAAVAAYERELQALQTSVEKQRSEIEGLLNNALSVEQATANAAQKASQQAALTQITAAVNSGKPYSSALAELEASGLGDIPAALSSASETGVVTLINLQSRFPDAARNGLSSARAVGSDDAEGGVGGFLRRQLGARSVAPREGSDPDAVLSRSEAAVRDGRLTDALAELDTLPAVAQEAMQDWIADAQARQAAEAAIDDLSQRLTAN